MNIEFYISLSHQKLIKLLDDLYFGKITQKEFIEEQYTELQFLHLLNNYLFDYSKDDTFSWEHSIKMGYLSIKLYSLFQDSIEKEMKEKNVNTKWEYNKEYSDNFIKEKIQNIKK